MNWPTRIAISLVVVFAVIQVVRPEMTNPPIVAAKTLHASGDAPPQIEAIFDRSCNDCHSNRTEWPWYAKVAPASWLLADHVKDGRREVNFSEWSTFTVKRKARKLKEICDQVRDRKMPLKSYLPLHSEAQLSDADRQSICNWATARIAALGPIPPDNARTVGGKAGATPAQTPRD